MEKTFYFDSAPQPYRAETAIVWCFDDRITLAVQKFLKRRNFLHVDSIRVAGGPKALASPGNEAEHQFLLDQIRLSRKLHGIERVILVLHSDCGAYGGIESFAGDVGAEREHHCAELARAAASLRAAVPDLEVEGFFVDFSGVSRVEIQLARSSGAD